MNKSLWTSVCAMAGMQPTSSGPQPTMQEQCSRSQWTHRETIANHVPTQVWVPVCASHGPHSLGLTTQMSAECPSPLARAGSRVLASSVHGDANENSAPSSSDTRIRECPQIPT